MRLQEMRNVFAGLKKMKRCKICKGLHDVRGDGLCGGCYDNRMAAQFGMSCGKYIAVYGHNLGRRVDGERRRTEAVINEKGAAGVDK